MRLVVKVGTSSLTDEEGRVDSEAVGRLAVEVAKVRAMDHQVVLVSSGAIAAGLPALGWSAGQRPRDPRTRKSEVPATRLGFFEFISLEIKRQARSPFATTTWGLRRRRRNQRIRYVSTRAIATRLQNRFSRLKPIRPTSNARFARPTSPPGVKNRGPPSPHRRLIYNQPINDAGWSSPVAREAHNLEVAGSNPVPAT